MTGNSPVGNLKEHSKDNMKLVRFFSFSAFPFFFFQPTAAASLVLLISAYALLNSQVFME